MIRFGQKNKDTISIELGAFYIKFVLGKFNNGKLSIDKMLKIPLDIGIFENGSIINEDALRLAIDSGIKQLNTNAKDVIVSLESSEILKREIQIPKVDNADLKGLIEFEVTQYLPIELSEYVIQYQIISSEIVDEKEKLNVLIVAMPRSMAVYYFELLKDLKLNPIHMELSGNNVVKFLQHVNEDILLGKTVAVVDLGYTSADLVILENNINKLNRYLQIGYYQTERYLVDSYELDSEDARKLLKQYQDIGIKQLISAKKAYDDLLSSNNLTDIDAEDLNDTAAEKMDVISKLLEQTAAIADEIDKVIKYFTFKERGRKVDMILLLGGYARINEFVDYLADRLNIKAKLVDNSNLRNISFNCQTDDLEIYISAIGGLIK